MERHSDKLISQIERILKLFPPVKESWIKGHMESGFQRHLEYETLITEAISIVRSIYGTTHPHYQRVLQGANSGDLYGLIQMEGVLVGTRESLSNGLLEDLTSRITIDLKSDFLATAHQLAEEGQKDPAAVLGGPFPPGRTSARC
jgi:hypothetical protein